MRLVIISGRSGSGKTTALRALEDCGFNCIDNFPVDLLQSLVHNAMQTPADRRSDIAVCIDARNPDLQHFPEILVALDRAAVDCQVIYLDALTGTLVKRFSETRRRHPLTATGVDLLQAIEAEGSVLKAIADLADLTVDTTFMRGSELVHMIKSRVAEKVTNGISLLFRSFGFKFGVPVDADVVFDLRCLPNPYWEPDLRPLSGLDPAVSTFLSAAASVEEMFLDIARYLERWVPEFEANNRVYMTVALGCTGGQHRSVYMAERLGTRFADRFANVLVRHRELGLVEGS